MPKQKVFFGKTFALSGTLSVSHKDLEEEIRHNGGDFSTSVSQRVTYLITTEEDVNQKSSKVKKAEQEEIPTLTEQFIRDSIEQGKLQEEESYALHTNDFVKKNTKEKQEKIQEGDQEEEDEEYDESEESDEDDDGLVRYSSDEFIEDEEFEMTKKRKVLSPRGNSTEGKPTQTNPPAKRPKEEKPNEKPIKRTTNTKKKEKQELMAGTDFLRLAKPFHVRIAPKGGEVLEMEVAPRIFKSGRYGWGIAGKVVQDTVSKREVKARVTLNLLVRGSHKQRKEEKREEIVAKKVEEVVANGEGEEVRPSELVKVGLPEVVVSENMLQNTESGWNCSLQ